jgi:hypothetical protein
MFSLEPYFALDSEVQWWPLTLPGARGKGKKKKAKKATSLSCVNPGGRNSERFPPQTIQTIQTIQIIQIMRMSLDKQA